MVQGWEAQSGSFPRMPANVHVSSSYLRGTFDIHWDAPEVQWANVPFSVLGVNIYRSDFSDRGPFFRLNNFPLGGTFYRDATEVSLIQNEVITPDRFVYRGDAPNNRDFTFKTLCPIVKREFLFGPYQRPTWANSAYDVSVSINGEIVPVHSVFGKTGEVTLVNLLSYDSGSDQAIAATLPGENDVVTVSYFTQRNFIATGLDRKIFYRLTTVGRLEDGNLIETPLNFAEPHTNQEVEVVDYIWREAMRRNNWILEQGGERVKVFIKKRTGDECGCARHVHAKTKDYFRQPSNRCETCYGTGFVGGYEGPFDIIVGPDDGERRVAQTPQGRKLEHTYQVWTGPSPMLTQRDFIVRQNGERCSIGPITRPSNRGNILQQMFTIQYFDEQDIRYRVPLDNPTLLPWPESRRTGVLQLAYPGRQPQPGYIALNDADGNMAPPYPEGPNPVSPQATEKDNIPDDRELRGRTKVWENINY